ncbi:N-acetyltransferase [Methylobacterium bullatum]|uniref:N-acetyltransferase domain-containing protein n=1 Tax=Methylobacterium bullatum TaxID=570505 RepID=A0A679JF85_9HYPH|nr:hypothetical protein MBLL_00676 [Methylobacterium bullatum]
MTRQLKLTKFRELDINDPFFQSLKDGYSADFVKWFESKKDEDLYIVHDGKTLSGMVYLKEEEGVVDDIDPPLPNRRWLKVGTFKLEKKGTKLGERVVKKIFDTAILKQVDGIYVTVFQVHVELISLFEKYGFKKCGVKKTKNGVEDVYKRDLDEFTGDMVLDYPFIHRKAKKAWLLAIYPEFHTRLLPDSILRNEPLEIVQDVSHSNTIHKVYIAHVSFKNLKEGDAVVFYRTKPKTDKAPAKYRSVATSVCVVEEVKQRRDFADVDDFLKYCRPRSVYDEKELRFEFGRKGVLSVAKMTYNAAFNRRLTREALMDEVGIGGVRWNLVPLTEDQFDEIVRLGEINARLIID